MISVINNNFRYAVPVVCCFHVNTPVWDVSVIGHHFRILNWICYHVSHFCPICILYLICSIVLIFCSWPYATSLPQSALWINVLYYVSYLRRSDGRYRILTIEKGEPLLFHRPSISRPLVHIWLLRPAQIIQCYATWCRTCALIQYKDAILSV